MRNHNSKEKENYEIQRNHHSPFANYSIRIDRLQEYLPRGCNHGVCGSRNLGNTCYMNSSIACLSNCLELTCYFLSKDYQKDINKENKDGLKGRLANSCYNLLTDYWKKNTRVGNPIEIKQLISKKNRKFAGDDQQDSNEFMTVFLELLGEDLNATTNKKYVELKEQQEDESDIDAAGRFWQLHLQRNNSIITYLFHGLFKSTIICPVCHCHNITYEPFNTLTLTIPGSGYVKRLQKRKKNRNKSVNKIKKKPKIKYEKFNLFYIPPLSLCQTKKFEITINPTYSLNKIIKEIQNRQNDTKITNPLQFISVTNKECQKYLDPTTPKPNENFIFGYQFELRGNFAYSIPVYLSNGEQKSSYPRMLFFQRNATYGELKKKIYTLVRKYIQPFDRKTHPETDEELKKFIDGNSNSLEKLLNSINKEFEYIENYTSNQNFNLLHNFPYEIILQNQFEYDKSDDSFIQNRISYGKKDYFRVLTNYNIQNYESYIDKLLNEIKNLKQFLIIKFNQESPYLRKDIRFDTCSVVNCEDIDEEEDNYNKMSIESENSTHSDEEMIDDNNTVTLDHCLQYFIEEECLEEGNEWHCEKCKKPVKASKKIEIFYLPKIMSICLTRFYRRGKRYTKNEEYVDFPLENLDMGKYMCGPDKDFLKYDLFAVSQHYGGMGSGHYIAACKNLDGRWYRYDDSNVSEIRSINDIRDNSAYVLFFTRKYW